MIPEYKLYHGAALAELIHELSGAIAVTELNESGRLSSYILNDEIGLQIKHSTQRLSPWAFTFTRYNMSELLALRAKFDNVFVLFVCETCGFVCLTVEELISISDVGQSSQVWIRIEKRRGKWFGVHGALGQLAYKKPNGLELLVRCLEPGRNSSLLASEQQT